MKYKAFARHNFHKIPSYGRLNNSQVRSIKYLSEVFPFKTNNYVVNELIDWDNYLNDPMFILNFPQESMLSPSQFRQLAKMVEEKSDKTELARYVNELRHTLNPHPAGQLEHNVPILKGKTLSGFQHKYRETVLYFPTQGQTCHAYCTFCFRWPQFTGQNDLKFASKQPAMLVAYLKDNPAVTDILFTGGDPMVMKATVIEKYMNALLEADLPNLKTIRIGSKSLSFWPYRFITDDDSDQLLNLFRRITDSGIHLAFMAHFNHYRELETDAVREAVKRIRSTGAQIRTQSPLIRHINDDPGIWATMWQKQVDMGMIPYYMFIARDTGAHSYFAVTLERSHQIYNEAYKQISGICRTVRGPSMSAGPGKIRIVGITEIDGQKVFALEFLQGRNPDWVGKPFFAEFNSEALWLDELSPAFGANEFFYEKEYRKLLKVDKIPGRTMRIDDRKYA